MTKLQQINRGNATRKAKTVGNAKARLPGPSMTVYHIPPTSKYPMPQKKKTKRKRKIDPTHKVKKPNNFRAFTAGNTANGAGRSKAVSHGAKGEKEQWKQLLKWANNSKFSWQLPKKTSPKKSPSPKSSGW